MSGRNGFTRRLDVKGMTQNSVLSGCCQLERFHHANSVANLPTSLENRFESVKVSIVQNLCGNRQGSGASVRRRRQSGH